MYIHFQMLIWAKTMSRTEDPPPAEKFFNELYSCFLRWWEESDLEEEDMISVGTQVMERFSESGVEFESDIDLSDIEDE